MENKQEIILRSGALLGVQQAVMETERLLLKELSPEIMDSLFASGTDADVMSFMGINDAELLTEKENHSKGLTTYRMSFKSFVMVEKAGGAVVGRCGFHNWYGIHARAELGYMMKNEAAKRRGLMTEAVTAIIAYGFNQMGLNRIEAMVGPDNEASLKIVSRCGFKQEGYLRSHYNHNGVMQDSVVFGLLKTEWAAQVLADRVALAGQSGLSQMSMDEITAEVKAARNG